MLEAVAFGGRFGNLRSPSTPMAERDEFTIASFLRSQGL